VDLALEDPVIGNDFSAHLRERLGDHVN
jgi:hypothetical protein